MAGPPLCTGYAFHASRWAGARYPAYFGLALASVELLFLLTLMVVGVT
jgi:hypothetical protein